MVDMENLDHIVKNPTELSTYKHPLIVLFRQFEMRHALQINLK